MSHWAEIDSENKVIRVLVCDNNDPVGDQGYQWLTTNLGGTWIATSYNTRGGVHSGGKLPIHKNYAGIGYTFDGIGFAPPQPYSSWSLNSDTYLWEAPTPIPTDGKSYEWDESTTSWVETPAL
jgi:hypothetical protein